MKKIIYIAGAMTGIPLQNRPAFLKASRDLEDLNPTAAIISPARNYGGNTNLRQETYMRYSIHQLLLVTHVYMLLGWEDSKGATCEHTIAESLGLTITYEPKTI